MMRMKGLGVGLILGAVCCAVGCEESGRTANGGEGGDSSGGTTVDRGGSTVDRGGSAGDRPGTGGTINCDGIHCVNGGIVIGNCPSSAFTYCDRSVSGVSCVAVGMSCPTLGTGGDGGQGGEGGEGRPGGEGGAAR